MTSDAALCPLIHKLIYNEKLNMQTIPIETVTRLASNELNARIRRNTFTPDLSLRQGVHIQGVGPPKKVFLSYPTFLWTNYKNILLFVDKLQKYFKKTTIQAPRQKYLGRPRRGGCSQNMADDDEPQLPVRDRASHCTHRYVHEKVSTPTFAARLGYVASPPTPSHARPLSLASRR